MSVAESLLNAIGAGKVPTVQFKRGPTDHQGAFDAICRVIGSNLEGTRRIARQEALRKLQEEHPHFKLRAMLRRIIDSWELDDEEHFKATMADVKAALSESVEPGK